MITWQAALLTAVSLNTLANIYRLYLEVKKK